MKKKNQYKTVALACAALVIGFFLVAYGSHLPVIGKYLQASSVYVRDTPEPVPPMEPAVATTTAPVETPMQVIAQHQARPEPLKALYISSWSAGSKAAMTHLLGLIARTEINAVVVDIKDATGRISFHVNDPVLKAQNTDSNRIANIDALIAELHAHHVYVIGRVSTFQDPLFAKLHPELAVIRESDGGIWRDRKGLSWLDAGARSTWDYLISIAYESYSRGFDEINFDYIRFPSDGNMTDIAYRFYKEQQMTKPEQLELFYQYLDDAMKDGNNENGIPHSADLFGMTTTADDDMGIGQMLEGAMPYFDYISPMVYPSHYGAGIDGYKNPAAHPYEMVSYALAGAKIKAAEVGEPFSKIRPWLQDFDLGAIYDAPMVKAQIKAVQEAGLTSWLLWDPANHYTEWALNAE